MSIQLSANSFLQMLAHSGLLSREQMQTVEQTFPASERSSTPKAICDWLLKRSLITEWHAEKLLQSKFRGFFLGPYKLLNRVARGGMSTIYAASHVQSGEVHALKVLPPARTATASYLPRFQREAAITQRLQHPNIVRVFGFYSESDGQDAVHFIAMELIRGRDLFESVNADGPMACRQAVEYIVQAAIGLHHAHEEGLVHRDIKPGNLFVADDGRLRILDLGLAQDFDSEENLTREFNERVLGTADYLAPEQAADSHTVDRRADIYSLGCSLYFLLTGRPPFTEGTLVQRLVAHQTKSPPPVSQVRDDVPEELIVILTAMMEKKREHRVSTAAEVADRLNSFLANTAGQAGLDCPPLRAHSQNHSSDAGLSSTSTTDSVESIRVAQQAAETMTSASDDSSPNTLRMPPTELASSEEEIANLAVPDNAPDIIAVSNSGVYLEEFGELLRTIEEQCDPEGALANDPRRSELLAVARRLLEHPDNPVVDSSHPWRRTDRILWLLCGVLTVVAVCAAMID